MNVKIVVFGKKNCKLCDAAKKNLGILGLLYEFVDHTIWSDAHEGWRTDGSVEVMAFHAQENMTMPVMRVDGKLYTYPMAMHILKEMLKTEVAMSVEAAVA